MNRMKRAVALLLFLSLLWPSDPALAAGDQSETPIVEQAAEGSVQEGQEAQTASRHAPAATDQALYQQIQATYKAAKKRSRRRSFKGYCGAYVANQLVVLGINTSYLSANGKNTYDIYRKMDCTSGGYRVSAYGAKKYSLSEALGAIMRQDPSATNILVGFQRGVSKSGRKYGHVLFIHGIRDGRIYFSDSSARTVDEVTYKEGEPIVCPLASFLELYAKYKLDGVVHFEKADTPPQSSIAEETMAGSSEKTLAEG